MTSPDVLVIGAGPWGRAIAWRAARAGAAVTMVDDGRDPAAWAAAGMLGPWSEAIAGEEDLFTVQLRALAAWSPFLSELAEDGAGDVGHVASGTVYTATRAEDVAVLRRRSEHLVRLGHDASWQPGSNLRDVEPALAPGVAGGFVLAGEAQVDPRLLLATLATVAATQGVRVVRGGAATLRRRGGAVCGATLASGESVSAHTVVLAAGWESGRLASRVPLRPVKGQAIRLRAAVEDASTTTRVVRTPSVYIVPRGSGEIVIGATSEERADLRPTVEGVHELLDDALRVLPALREAAFAEVAVGLRPATHDGAPALGRDPEDGLVWAVGGYRHGILLTPLAAEAITATIQGQDLPGLGGLSPTRFGSREPACA